MKQFLTAVTSVAAFLGAGASAAAVAFVCSSGDTESLRLTLLVTAAILVLLVVLCVAVWLLRRRNIFGTWAAAAVTVAAVLQAAVFAVCFLGCGVWGETPAAPSGDLISSAPTQTEPSQTTDAVVTEPPVTEPPVTEPVFLPHKTDANDPKNWNMVWEIMADGALVENYTRPEPIFMDGSDYFSLPGIATFRGNNYRSEATYGTAQITDGKLEVIWKQGVRYISDPKWVGCGWTGQPLVVQWDDETKSIMNLYEEKKNKEDLVEVIYAKMDGYVHFFDLEDGSATRDPVYLGMVCKGAGALDPRGYPLLYVGSGIEEKGKTQRMYIVSLIDGKILYEKNGSDSFTKRWWFAFDSSPLVDADTDTLIWPGESGILYTIRLNTQYSKDEGTISVTPDEPVKTRYMDDYRQKYGRYLGYEGSACVVGNYLYIGDNSGMFQCIDLNTMELIWVQDVQDDVNSTPLFEWGDDGRGYLYIAPSLEYAGKRAEVPIYKLDAQTGEVIWSVSFPCTTAGDGSGGVLASPLLGRAGTDIEDLVFYAVGHSPNLYDGQLVALDRKTGEVVWQVETDNYAWSSPVALYTPEGKSYVFLSDASGRCRLYDGITGAQISALDLGQTVEASPVVFENTIVLGTRSAMYLIRVS